MSDNAEARQDMVDSTPEELDVHLAAVFRKYATNMESLIAMLENGQYIPAWKKAQGVRDAFAYYYDRMNKRVENRNEDSSE